MRMQQAGDLHRQFLATFRWPRNQRHIGHVRRHRDAHAAQYLNAFGNRVDKLILLAVMLVEQQMQLIERRSRDLPVVLLVQVAQRHRVSEQLIEIGDAFLADVLR